ncbi:MAG: aldehyde dehydrogenase family protein [Woeseiaceae bacterium]
MSSNVETKGIFLDGVWADGQGEVLPVQDPSTGDVFAEIANGTPAEIDAAVASARQSADGEWGRMTAVDRGRVLRRISDLLLENVAMLAGLEARDVGKPLSQAKADALAIARYFEFYAGATDKIHGETIPYQDGYTVYTLREPHGVTAHIIPWNYPLQIIGRSVGAALAMGNAAVLKPAEEASLSSLAFIDIAREAGLPAGALNVVTGVGEIAGAALASHAGIDHISFTGSVSVGQLIQAAAAENVVPVTLELGGKSPQIVFDDADLEAAMPFLVRAGIQNAGQTCSAASRVMIHRSIYDEVVDRLASVYADLRVGAAQTDPDVGPLISAKQKSLVERLIDEGESRGNQVAVRSRLNAEASANGFYVRPTLFVNVDPLDSLAQDEIFGPVQIAMPFDSEDEAVAVANGTDFGLVAGIWTRDGARQMRLAKSIRSGQIFVNNYGAGGGVELPFGGIGKSGHGREKGFEALYGFSVLKTIAAYHG